MANIRIPLNLASEPFQRNRPILVASGVLVVLLLGTLILQISMVVRERDAASESRVAREQMERQAQSLVKQRMGLEVRLRAPENAAVFERSVFINQLLRRKGISWTRMFDDLAKIMPGKVRLVAIRPSLTAENQVQLDMVVAAATPDPIIELLTRLEKSDLFGATALLNSQPPSQQDPVYRYRVSVNYAQKL